MADKIRCPYCQKMNEMQKFCIYCGKQLFSEAEFKLRSDNPEPYCLNCGRPVRENQIKCECGYGFGDITCPKCGAKKEYTDKFCTDCGEKLWRSDVQDSSYYESFFKSQNFVQTVLPSLRNTSLYGRCKPAPQLNFPGDDLRIGADAGKIRSDISRMNNALREIGSRWKIVSPSYCLSCLNVMEPDQYTCEKCGFSLVDEKRVRYLQDTSGSYASPVFDRVELKWTSKYGKDFLGSLAPSIGESQFEYRERLKWEFAEINYHKKNMKAVIKAIGRKKQSENAESNSTRSQRVRQVRPEPVVDEGEIVSERFPYQFQDFSRNIRDICRDNGGDVSRFDEGILGCPKCSNNFHYLASKFIETHRCPYCGVHFNITAPIYEYEWDASGISFDEYMDEYYGFFNDR